MSSPISRPDREGAEPLDELLARLPVGDEVGDRDAAQPVLGGEGRDLRPLHHRAVVVGELADRRDRRQPGEPAEVDRGLGMAGAHEHAAVLGDQREDVAGAHEVGSAHVVVGERPHGVRALLGRDAGRQAVPDVDRDREGGAERRVVRRHHRIEAQPARLRDRQRRADDAAGMADDERHLLRRAQRGRDDEVALVLAIVVVGDDDDLAAGEGLDGLGDGIGHQGFSNGHGTALADLGAMAQELVGDDAGHHRLADRHGADADARVVAALGDDLGRLVVARHRLARRSGSRRSA